MRGGRFYEITGIRPKLSRANAENWYGYTSDSYIDSLKMIDIDLIESRTRIISMRCRRLKPLRTILSDRA